MTKEWNKAAGCYDPDPQHPKGPFLGDNVNDPGIAIRLPVKDPPRPVGTSKADISVFLCRDMAGNGKELTRELAKEIRNCKTLDQFLELPISIRDKEDAPLIRLRGRSWHESEPFQFAFVLNPKFTSEMTTLAYTKEEVDTSFRVLLEIPKEYR
jgi:hypothetical protein